MIEKFSGKLGKKNKKKKEKFPANHVHTNRTIKIQPKKKTLFFLFVWWFFRSHINYPELFENFRLYFLFAICIRIDDNDHLWVGSLSINPTTTSRLEWNCWKTWMDGNGIDDSGWGRGKISGWLHTKFRWHIWSQFRQKVCIIIVGPIRCRWKIFLQSFRYTPSVCCRITFADLFCGLDQNQQKRLNQINLVDLFHFFLSYLILIKFLFVLNKIYDKVRFMVFSWLVFPILPPGSNRMDHKWICLCCGKVK